jgi:hypothetical protein
METRVKKKLLVASLSDQGAGKVKIVLGNRTGHPEDYYILGVTPRVTIGLDGNTTYAVTLDVALDATIVEVRQGGRDGEVLALLELEHR